MARILPSWRPRWQSGYRFVATLTRPVVALLFRLRVEGAPPTVGPFIVAANHVSFLDPVALGVTLHRRGHAGRFLVVAAVLRRPVVGAALLRGGAIPVAAERWPRAVAARRARETLDVGGIVVIYPEGTVTAAGADLPARPGVAWLSRTTGAPVVPVAHWGMERSPRRLAWLRRRRAGLVFGRPVAPVAPVACAGAVDDALAAAEVLVAVRALIPRARRVALGDAPGDAPGDAGWRLGRGRG